MIVNVVLHIQGGSWKPDEFKSGKIGCVVGSNHLNANCCKVLTTELKRSDILN